MNDEILGKVVDKIRQLGWEQTTDIIITQDHNHSTVSGDVTDYPLRGIVENGVGSHDPQGYSVSGFVRTAQSLAADVLKAYDGAGCRDIPTLSGSCLMVPTFTPPRMTRTEASAVKRKNTPQQVTWFPAGSPGGNCRCSERRERFLFVPDGDPDTVNAAVVSLQSRLQFGAIFVSDRYGDIAGTLPMSLIKTENTITGRGPDIIVSFTFDEKVTVTGRPGISYASSVNRKGDHGSFSRNRYAYFHDGLWAKLHFWP